MLQTESVVQVHEHAIFHILRLLSHTFRLNAIKSNQNGIIFVEPIKAYD